jgi:hypothetical protein
MIKFKSGAVIQYEENLDLFFQKIFDVVIADSKKIVDDNLKGTESNENVNELYLKEIMNACITVTHQLFEMQRKFPEISRFIISGFIFNGILMAIQNENVKLQAEESTITEKNTIH